VKQRSPRVTKAGKKGGQSNIRERHLRDFAVAARVRCGTDYGEKKKAQIGPGREQRRRRAYIPPGEKTEFESAKTGKGGN